jgi:NMD protein affecting ribosome stability and mRNA decay
MVRSLVGKHPNYYEAIIQVRDNEQEVEKFMKNLIDTKKLLVNKISKMKNGQDYFCADNDQARAMSKKLQQTFGGEIKTTSSLHTQIDGKDMYRVTFLFRQAPFKKGDEVEYDEEIWEVKSLIKDIFLKNKKSGKKVHIRYRNMSQVKKI